MRRILDYLGLALGAVMTVAVVVLGYVVRAKARKVHELEGDLMKKDFEAEDTKAHAKIEEAKKNSLTALAQYERDRDAYLRARGAKAPRS